MPEFNKQVYVDIDVSVSDFLDECSSFEIQEVVEWLRENGDLDEFVIIPKDSNPQDEIFNEGLKNLIDNRYLLSTEEEELIMNIAKKHSY